MNKEFSVDTRLFQTKVKKLLRTLNIEEKDFIREQGQQLALDCARRTPPFASGKIRSTGSIGTTADKRQGEYALTNDWKKVFRQLGNQNYWTSEHIRKLIRRGDTEALTAILKNVKSKNRGLEVVKFDERYHSRARNRRGRVPGGTTPIVAIPQTELNKGLKNALKRVGTAKAGFLRCAQLLGYNGRAPAWVTRNLNRTTSSGSMIKRPNGWRAEFRSTARGHQHVVPLMPMLMRVRMNKATKRLLAIFKHSKKKAGW